MTQHRDFIRAFDAGLKTGKLPPGTTARDPSEAARRFNVYRNNVAHSLNEALAARFPAIQRLVGAEFFAAMARVFAEQHRPQSPILQDWGGAFPEFLAQFPPLAAHPYMPDVARIEWARGRAYHASDATPIDAGTLAGADPAQLTMGLHPSVRLVDITPPAFAIWHNNQPGTEPIALDQDSAQCVMIHRLPNFDVQVHELPPADRAFVREVALGAHVLSAATTAQMIDPAHRAQTILAYLIQSGAAICANPPSVTS